jgi:hypothetical protein
MCSTCHKPIKIARRDLLTGAREDGIDERFF